MRVKRVVLEHHGDVTRARFQIVHDRPADLDHAAADRLKPRHHAQKRGLAAARRADDHHEFAILHVDGDAMDDFGLAIALADIFQR